MPLQIRDASSSGLGRDNNRKSHRNTEARVNYLPASTVAPAAHSAWPQLHAMDGRLAEPSQWAPQYLLPLAAEQLQPGCALFPTFFSDMTTPLFLGEHVTAQAAIWIVF